MATKTGPRRRKTSDTSQKVCSEETKDNEESSDDEEDDVSDDVFDKFAKDSDDEDDKSPDKSWEGEPDAPHPILGSCW